jgi:hypothetical protein
MNITKLAMLVLLKVLLSLARAECATLRCAALRYAAQPSLRRDCEYYALLGFVKNSID